MSKPDLGSPIAPIVLRPGTQGRLIVLLPYSPERVAKIKAVPGRRWDPKERYWTVPHTDTAIADLAEPRQRQRGRESFLDSSGTIKTPDPISPIPRGREDHCEAP